MVMEVNPVQLWNALEPILVTVLVDVNVMEVNPVQP